MMGSGNGNGNGPFRGCALKITFGLKRFNSSFKVAEVAPVQTEYTKYHFPNLFHVRRRQSHVASDVRFGLLSPRCIAADGEHHRTDIFPMVGGELFNELKF